MRKHKEQISAAIPIGENAMNKPYYQNFYKLQMAMMEQKKDNVLIFGPASSGKCDALERCIEEYGKENNVVLLTRKTALLMVAYQYPNVTCINWDTSIKNINPEWFKEDYDVIIIDGYCENWHQIVNKFPNKRIIMAVRANTNQELSTELKRNFRIVAKCGFTSQDYKTKGITGVRVYKG